MDHAAGPEKSGAFQLGARIIFSNLIMKNGDFLILRKNHFQHREFSASVGTPRAPSLDIGDFFNTVAPVLDLEVGEPNLNGFFFVNGDHTVFVFDQK